MAISQVRVQINGSWHTLTKGSNGKYSATITAPGRTSYHEYGNYFNVKVEATNTAGTIGTADASDLSGLRLFVKERIAPVITIKSPSVGAYVTNNRQPVVFEIKDESGGSGVNINSLVVKQDGTAVNPATITHTHPEGNTFKVTYTPDSALSDGQHYVSIDVKDFDGNSATKKEIYYNIDTVPPTLNVSEPAEGLVTASQTITVSGSTNDQTSSPVTVRIKLNGSDQGNVEVKSSGQFDKSVMLVEGNNTIIVTATDTAGKQSSLTRNVVLDTSVPVVTSATIQPNPVDVGNTMIITVEVTG